jgi:hypothetical protein
MATRHAIHMVPTLDSALIATKPKTPHKQPVTHSRVRSCPDEGLARTKVFKWSVVDARDDNVFARMIKDSHWWRSAEFSNGNVTGSGVFGRAG